MDQSVHIKLALSQAAWLRFFFEGKSVVLHLLEGPELRMRYFVMRRMLYHFATMTAREVNLRDMVFGSV